MQRSSLSAAFVLASLVVVPLGCSHPATPDRDPDPVPFVPKNVGELSVSNELAGQVVEAREEGPWSMRSTVSSGSRSEDGRRRALGKSMPGSSSRALTLEMDGVDAGGVVRSPASAGVPAKRARGGPPPGSGPEPEPVADSEAEPELESGDDGGRPADKSRAELARKKGELGDREKSELYELSASKRALQSRTLKAGATDDNADFDAYLEFLLNWPQKDVMKAGYQPLDVRDRKFIRVVDADGRPVPGAVVGVTDVDADRRVATLTTYGDGRAPFYPHVAGAAGAETVSVPTSGFVVEALVDGMTVRTNWNAEGEELELRLDQPRAAPETIRLDALFVIDTTGSMSDEIAAIKASLLKVTAQLRSLEREFDLRYGAVLFRDVGDEYLTATHPFTSDIAAFDKALKAVAAGGGGDGPESVNQGLAQGVDGVDWRQDAAKVMFLIGDAPPHMDYPGDTWYGESLKAAVAKGIRIHSVAASGLDARGSLVWRQIAQYTRGKFIFIEYGGAAKSAASHGVAGKVKSNNLEDILFEQIRDEVAHFGR